MRDPFLVVFFLSDLRFEVVEPGRVPEPFGKWITVNLEFGDL